MGAKEEAMESLEDGYELGEKGDAVVHIDYVSCAIDLALEKQRQELKQKMSVRLFSPDDEGELQLWGVEDYRRFLDEVFGSENKK